MRAEDALLGAFVQLALSQRRLDDAELELVERSIDAAALRRRGAIQGRLPPPRSSTTPYLRRKRKQKPSAATRLVPRRLTRRPSTR